MLVMVNNSCTRHQPASAIGTHAHKHSVPRSLTPTAKNRRGPPCVVWPAALHRPSRATGYTPTLPLAPPFLRVAFPRLRPAPPCPSQCQEVMAPIATSGAARVARQPAPTLLPWKMASRTSWQEPASAYRHRARTPSVRQPARTLTHPRRAPSLCQPHSPTHTHTHLNSFLLRVSYAANGNSTNAHFRLTPCTVPHCARRLWVAPRPDDDVSATAFHRSIEATLGSDPNDPQLTRFLGVFVHCPPLPSFAATAATCLPVPPLPSLAPTSRTPMRQPAHPHFAHSHRGWGLLGR